MDNKAMFKIGYGLYVLTACENGRDNGCIINTVMQVTDTPRAIAVTVNKLNYTGGMIERTGMFNLSVLTTDAPFSVFENFGFKSGATTGKFTSFKYVKRSDSGALYLTNWSNAYLSAKVTQSVDLGTHLLYIAEVTDAAVLSGSPSVTYDYYHQNIKPNPPVADKSAKTGQWRCNICGYIYEGDELPSDFVCPLCKHGAADFTKIN